MTAPRTEPALDGVLARSARFRSRRARRRRVWMAASGVVVLAGGVLGGVALQGRPRIAATPPAVASDGGRQANWIVAENRRPGSSGWQLTPPPKARGIDGYADAVSAARGDTIRLFVSTPSPSFRVEAWRMGWYRGANGRLVWRSGDATGGVQAKPTVEPRTNLVEAHWRPSLEVTVTSDWPPGDYLLKLVASDGSQHWIPLTVRDDGSDAAIVVMNAVTTWQAYNQWGGYSLYLGPGGGRQRAQIVSFDRPYGGDGSADFLGNELPLVSLVEEMGLDVTYITDVDLHARPEQLLRHRALISLGHDEYWSTRMRQGVEAARDQGVNVAFLGANAVFRRIRLEPSGLGTYRREVNYRSAHDDPMEAIDRREVTVSWREPPVNRPESSLVGNFYECNPTKADGVVVDSSNWLFGGTGLQNGDRVPRLVGPEYDRVTPSVPTPRTIEVLMHSPLRCRGKASFSDVAYYTASSGAGVFSSGTSSWVCKLLTGCPFDKPLKPDPRIRRMTENLLRAFAAGPAGLAHPSRSNLDRLRIQKGTTSSTGPHTTTTTSVTSTSSEDLEQLPPLGPDLSVPTAPPGQRPPDTRAPR